MNFQQLGLSAPLIQAVEELGFQSPMPVQEAVIPHLLQQTGDLIALAQTGTGKTAAFGLPLLQLLAPSCKLPQAVILTPTRELCVQVAKDLTAYGKYSGHPATLAIYGGASIELQIRALRQQPTILVATPGRMLDILRRKATSLQQVHTVVLDEADVMLDMGFRDDLEEILSQVGHRERLLLFSATMNQEVRRIAETYLNAPSEIQIGAPNVANTNITHSYCAVPARHKYNALKRIVDFYPDIYGIVFCRTRSETKEVAEWLIRDGYNADALHGDLSQAQRDMVMHRFRSATVQLLVATDVAARGLDVNNLTHVLHYGLPDDIENYTHRSGRTARAGKTGASIAICHLRENSRIHRLQRATGATFLQINPPTGEEICAKQILHLADKLLQIHSKEESPEQIQQLLPPIVEKLSKLEKEELIRRIVTLEFSRLFAYYQSAQEIEVDDKRASAQASQRERLPKHRRESGGVIEEGMSRMFINLGKKDKLFPNRLIDFINRNVSGRVDIGKIDLFNTYSFFGVESERAAEVAEMLTGEEFNGREVIVDFASPEEQGIPTVVRPRGTKKERKQTASKGRKMAEQPFAESQTKPRSAKSSKKERSNAASYPTVHGSKYIPAPGAIPAKKQKRSKK